MRENRDRRESLARGPGKKRQDWVPLSGPVWANGLPPPTLLFSRWKSEEKRERKKGLVVLVYLYSGASTKWLYNSSSVLKCF